MRAHIIRIHHRFFTNEESVPDQMLLKVAQSRRSRIQILKMWPCNARTHFSHPPPAVYEWGECTRVHSCKSRSVQTVLPLIFKMECCNARTHFSHPPPRFYEWGACTRVYSFKSSSVQMVLHPNFENVTLQCGNKCFASTTSFFWTRRVYQSIFV